MSRRAGVEPESRRAVELGELAWQGERSLGSRKKFTFWTVLQVQGGLHGELGLGELQGDSREEEHIPELENFSRGRGGLQVEGSSEETNVYWVVQQPVTLLDEGHVNEDDDAASVLQ